MDFDAGLRLMEMLLQSYYERVARSDELVADGIRKEFAGAKYMLEALAGPKSKDAALTRLRKKGFKIPPCGDRDPAGNLIGWDSDTDM